MPKTNGMLSQVIDLLQAEFKRFRRDPPASHLFLLASYMLENVPQDHNSSFAIRLVVESYLLGIKNGEL